MHNTRILIVYYSRTGTTRRVAQALSAALQCDIEAVTETSSRAGILGYLRSVIEARRQQPSTDLVRASKDPSLYDLVILGSPVWAWSVSSPMRAYMLANRNRFASVAFFCTCGGSGSNSTLAQMQILAGKAPRARLFVTARQVARQHLEPRFSEFLHALAIATPEATGAGYAKAAKTSAIAAS